MQKKPTVQNFCPTEHHKQSNSLDHQLKKANKK